jgi:Protein of unknown function (DUF1161)
MSKLLALFAPLALACTASYADNCDTLREQIEGKIKAAGVASFTVVVVDSAANVPGKVVGTCGQGAKKIMYAQQSPAPSSTAPAAAAPASKLSPPAKKATDAILTECKDGTVSVGGSCKK